MFVCQPRSQNLRSPWPVVGKRELWEQPFQACAIDADCPVKQNGRIRLFPLLFQNSCSQSSRFPTADQGERRPWSEIVRWFVCFLSRFGVRMSGANIVLSEHYRATIMSCACTDFRSRVWKRPAAIVIKMASTNGDYSECILTSWGTYCILTTKLHSLSFLLTYPWNVEFCVDMLQETSLYDTVIFERCMNRISVWRKFCWKTACDVGNWSYHGL